MVYHNVYLIFFQDFYVTVTNHTLTVHVHVSITLCSTSHEKILKEQTVFSYINL